MPLNIWYWLHIDRLDLMRDNDQIKGIILKSYIDRISMWSHHMLSMRDTHINLDIITLLFMSFILLYAGLNKLIMLSLTNFDTMIDQSADTRDASGRRPLEGLRQLARVQHVTIKSPMPCRAGH